MKDFVIGFVICCVAVFSMLLYLGCGDDGESSIIETTTSTTTTEEETTTTTKTETTTTTTITTTTEETTTTSTTMTAETVTTSSTTETTEPEVITTITSDVMENLSYLGVFTGTYYKGATNPCNGGSGRVLVGCDVKSDSYKGSVASRLVYETYGYYVNGKTMIYLEFESFPNMNGWYSVDDCNADRSIIDFYFPNYNNCPWQNAGLTTVQAWIAG